MAAQAEDPLAHHRRVVREAGPDGRPQVERENAELIAQRPELATTLAGELRCLRTILHVVFAEQVARLG